jgi:oligoendopeptidase F
MSKELPNREKIEDKYKWELDDIYGNVETWEKDFNKVKELLNKVKKYQGRVADSGETLLSLLNQVMEIQEISARLYAYAHMSYDIDTRNNTNQSLFNRAQDLNNQISSVTSFIVPELLKIGEEQIKKYIENTDGLKLYQHYLENILRQEEHYLSQKEEKLLAMAGDVTQGPGNIFSMLNNADLKFPIIEDESGDEIRITHGRYIKFLKGKDREVRKKAFTGLYSKYEGFINTFASTLYSETKAHVFKARARNYDNSLSAALDGDNIPVKVYNNLISTVHDNLGPMYKYMNLRKELLNLDEIHMYDIYTPLIQELDIEIPYSEAKNTILEGLKPLGDEYLKNIQEGFKGGWIDVYENKGKRSGAYSSGCYGVHPYVLLNYNDNMSNMFTLAHEMGHALHSYYSNANQPFVYANYKIFVAEVASTLNEALLIHYLLKKTEDKQKRMYLINHYLEQFRGTLYRQTMFAEFEKIIHEKVEIGKPLTPEVLNKTYRDLNIKYYGDSVVYDKEIDKEWARIPHFYYNFYVYKYATGFSAAAALAKKIIDEGEAAITRYKDFLKSGNSDYPIEVLKTAGVDMTTPKPIETALGVFSDLVDQLEDLA